MSSSYSILATLVCLLMLFLYIVWMYVSAKYVWIKEEGISKNKSLSLWAKEAQLHAFLVRKVFQILLIRRNAPQNFVGFFSVRSQGSSCDLSPIGFSGALKTLKRVPEITPPEIVVAIFVFEGGIEHGAYHRLGTSLT